MLSMKSFLDQYYLYLILARCFFGVLSTSRKSKINHSVKFLEKCSGFVDTLFPINSTFQKLK